MKVLITGSTGFIGNALTQRLLRDQFFVSAVMRKQFIRNYSFSANLIGIDGLTATQDWSSALRGIDVLIHLAARTHVLNDKSRDPLSEYRYINVQCSLNLARQAAQAGVKRFIYISSVKVNGESSTLGRPFTAEDSPLPADPYAISKHEAELGLHLIAKEFGMELVVIRPPLVYGPGVKANFLSMMKWIRRGIPLPFGALTKNLRSYVFLDNITDLIVTCVHHPKAANQIFMVSDDEDMSTMELLGRVTLAMERPSKFVAVPPNLIMLGAKIIARPHIAGRLCSSLQVDIKKTKNLLNWSPPITVENALRQTVDYFLKMRT